MDVPDLLSTVVPIKCVGAPYPEVGMPSGVATATFTDNLGR